MWNDFIATFKTKGNIIKLTWDRVFKLKLPQQCKDAFNDATFEMY